MSSELREAAAALRPAAEARRDAAGAELGQMMAEWYVLNYATPRTGHPNEEYYLRLQRHNLGEQARRVHVMSEQARHLRELATGGPQS